MMMMMTMKQMMKNAPEARRRRKSSMMMRKLVVLEEQQQPKVQLEFELRIDNVKCYQETATTTCDRLALDLIPKYKKLLVVQGHRRREAAWTSMIQDGADRHNAPILRHARIQTDTVEFIKSETTTSVIMSDGDIVIDDDELLADAASASANQHGKAPTSSSARRFSRSFSSPG